MIELIRTYQLDIMLFFSGVCAVLIPLTWSITTLTRQRKWLLTLMELLSALLMIFDRFAYIYRGDVSELGYWMVRVSNFMTFGLQLSQQKVREELYKGIGTQFDPEFARLMIAFIDMDPSYTMQEGEQRTNQAITTHLQCTELYREYTEGTELIDRMIRLRLYSKPAEGFPAEESLPSLVLFDALDGRIHTDEFKQAENIIEAEQTPDFKGWNDWKEKHKKGVDITVTLERNGNTVTMETKILGLAVHSTTIVHDDVPELYAAITGDQCAITNIHITSPAT